MTRAEPSTQQEDRPQEARRAPVRLRLRGMPGRRWHHCAEADAAVYAAGHVVVGDTVFEGPALARLALDALLDSEREPGLEELAAWVAELAGSFGLVLQRSAKTWLVADRVRTSPLLYARSGAVVLLSDDTSWLLRALRAPRLDAEATTEFLLTGYVTGGETLVRSIEQLQAGELVEVSQGPDAPLLRRSRYFRYFGSPAASASQRTWAERMFAAFVAAFERLRISARGRQLVVPLSGGVDSRLVVGMLHLLGFPREQILCFSYGDGSNWEVRYSRRVAEQLGYDWRFVPISRRDWWRWYSSEDRARYFEQADHLASIAHPQDWPAVHGLRRSGRVADDALFVPGHTGDFISGGHIPPALVARPAPDRDATIEALLIRHYGLLGWAPDVARLKPLLRKRIGSRLARSPIEGAEQAASAYESWDWQERQAKFIVNSLRAYEYWGYDWRIPLWDRPVVDFFAGLPLSLKLGRWFYKAVLAARVFRPLKIDLTPRPLPSTLPGRWYATLRDPWYGRFTGDMRRPMAWLQRVQDRFELEHPLVPRGRLLLRVDKNAINAICQLEDIQRRIAHSAGDPALDGGGASPG